MSERESSRATGTKEKSAGYCMKVDPKSKLPLECTVEAGDNLTRIANHFKVALKKVEEANPQVKPPEYVIHPGEILKIPSR